MDAMILFLAKMMPTELIVEQMKKAIEEHDAAKLTNNKEAEDKAMSGIVTASLLIVTREMTDGQDMNEALKDIQHAKDVSEVLKGSSKEPKPDKHN